jgi:hypothetical protein
MTKTIDWDSLGEGKSGGNRKGKAAFTKTTAGTHQVRPLGHPVHFWKFVVKGSDGRWRSAVVADPDNNPIAKRHNIKASERFACVVLNRNSNAVEILEGGISIFGEFRKYFTHTQRNPGGPQGADFKIVVEGAGRTKKYITSFVKNTPLTDSEITMLKSMKAEGLFPNLEEVFKVVPDAELEKRLFDGEEQAVSAAVPSSAADDIGLDDVPNGDVSPDDSASSGDDLPF